MLRWLIRAILGTILLRLLLRAHRYSPRPDQAGFRPTDGGGRPDSRPPQARPADYRADDIVDGEFEEFPAGPR